MSGIQIPAFQVGDQVELFEYASGVMASRAAESGTLMAPMDENPDNTCTYQLDTGTVVIASPHGVRVNGGKLMLLRPIFTG